MTITTGQVKPKLPTNYRWVICALLFAAIVINYIHRQTFALLKDSLQHEYGLNENGYAQIVVSFQVAYAIGYIGFGRILDKLGARTGYGIAFVLWNLSHIAAGLTTTVLQFTISRIGLGLGESGSFPASIKAVTEWFPQKERAQAIGIFNAGSNVGAIVAPLIVPILTAAWGWRSSFIVTGGLGLLWVIAWIKLYKRPQEHEKVSPEELAYIQSNPADPVNPIAWWKLFITKETWVFASAKFLTDPIWWFYLFWLPDFLKKTYHMDLKSFGPPLVVIYLISDFGSVLGGWTSSTLIKRGVSVNIARKLTLLIFALMVLPVFLVDGVKNVWMAVFYIGIATAAHQAFSANLYALPSDLFPRSAVGTVIGIGGTAGAIGGILFSLLVGQILQVTHSYKVLFIIAGSVYLISLLLIHLLSPDLKRNVQPS